MIVFALMILSCTKAEDIQSMISIDGESYVAITECSYPEAHLYVVNALIDSDYEYVEVRMFPPAGEETKPICDPSLGPCSHLTALVTLGGKLYARSGEVGIWGEEQIIMFKNVVLTGSGEDPVLVTLNGKLSCLQ